MPIATVAAIIISKDTKTERILLTRRKVEPFKNMWCLPGGHIDNNEMAKNAIIREVKEEIGVELDPSFFGYFDEIIPEKNIHAIVLVFTGKWNGEITSNEDEVSETDWFSISQALSIPLAFEHKIIIDAYAKT